MNLDLEVGLSCQEVVRDPYTTVVKVCQEPSTRSTSQPDPSCPPFSPGKFVIYVYVFSIACVPTSLCTHTHTHKYTTNMKSGWYDWLTHSNRSTQVFIAVASSITVKTRSLEE